MCIMLWFWGEDCNHSQSVSGLFLDPLCHAPAALRKASGIKERRLKPQRGNKQMTRIGPFHLRVWVQAEARLRQPCWIPKCVYFMYKEHWDYFKCTLLAYEGRTSLRCSILATVTLLSSFGENQAFSKEICDETPHEYGFCSSTCMSLCLSLSLSSLLWCDHVMFSSGMVNRWHHSLLLCLLNRQCIWLAQRQRQRQREAIDIYREKHVYEKRD